MYLVGKGSETGVKSKKVVMKFENLLGQHGTAVAKRLGWKQGSFFFLSKFAFSKKTRELIIF